VILYSELAEIQSQLGQFNDAVKSLDRVINAAGPRTFAAFEVLQRLASTQNNDEYLARSHLGQATLLERAIQDPAAGDALGVPRWRRSSVHVAEACFRAALARHSAGNTSEAATLLEKARALAPEDPLIQHATLLCAEELGDFEVALVQAHAAAARTTGMTAALAWLRVALFELRRNDANGVMQAVANGLAVSPHSIALRGLELHTLAGDSEPARLATSQEACAELVTTDSAKSRFLLAAANTWARGCKDAASAQAALSQASLFGTSPSTVNRMARLLALGLSDSAWYDESTRRLASSASDPGEQLELWLELLRGRIIKNQPEKITGALTGLAGNETGQWLSAMLDALWQSPGATDPSGIISSGPLTSAARAEPPLKRCARLCSNEPLHRAYDLANARRELLAGHYEEAIADLQELATLDPSDFLTALTLTNIQLEHGTTAAAISSLCAAASSIENDTLAAMLAIRASLLAIRTNDAEHYWAALDSAQSRAPIVVATVESWLNRSPLPELEARIGTESNTDSTVATQRGALESFAREIRQHDVTAAGEALDRVSDDDSSLGLAVAIAKTLFDSPVTPNAIERLGALLPSFKPVLGALRVRYAVVNCGVPSAEHLAAARHWSEVDPDTASALEFLAAARAEGKIDAEKTAWALLDERSTDRTKPEVQLARARFRLLGEAALPPLVSAHSVQAKLVNLETSRPGCDPRRRRQSLLDVTPLLDETDQRVCSILIAFNLLAAGAIEPALQQFKELVARDPASVSAWEGLRLAAELFGDLSSVAQACEALGKCMGDASTAAEFYEQAATLYLNELQDDVRGEQLLSLAVASDISRFTAFDRLFRRIRERNDGPRLLELIDLRLNVSEDVSELVKLHWERARVLRGLGERDAAMQALENVTLLEPEHVGALALAAEISISSHQLADACKYLDQLARLDSAPDKQRLMSAMAAADIYQSKLSQPERAVSLLLALRNSRLGTLAVRERLARCAAQAEDWQLSCEVSLGLAKDRETSAGRVEAARLALSICREKLSTPSAALPAVMCILAEIPADLEAIDFILEQPFSEPENGELFTQVRRSLCDHLRDTPCDAEAIDRLAQLAAVLDDRPLRQVALGALVTVDAGTPDILNELAALDARVARAPSIVLDSDCDAALADPNDCGPISDLFKQLAPLYNETFGPSLTALGVNKKHRLDPRAGLPLRNEIAAWAGALGLGEFDVYVGGVDANDVVGVPGETPALVVGTALRAPLPPQHRQLVARELYAVRQGTSILRHRSPAEAAALIVATCRLAEVAIVAPPYAMVDEFVRLLNASIPRRTRKLLPALCRPLSASALDSTEWFAAAIASRDRVATIAAGDVSLVLGRNADLGTVDNTLSLSDRRRRMLPFIFSPAYLSLRARLGVAVK
jgi:cellulose synthase operon protein C